MGLTLWHHEDGQFDAFELKLRRPLVLLATNRTMINSFLVLISSGRRLSRTADPTIKKCIIM